MCGPELKYKFCGCIDDMGEIPGQACRLCEGWSQAELDRGLMNEDQLRFTVLGDPELLKRCMDHCRETGDRTDDFIRDHREDIDPNYVPPEVDPNHVVEYVPVGWDKVVA